MCGGRTATLHAALFCGVLFLLPSRASASLTWSSLLCPPLRNRALPVLLRRGCMAIGRGACPAPKGFTLCARFGECRLVNITSQHLVARSTNKRH